MVQDGFALFFLLAFLLGLLALLASVKEDAGAILAALSGPDGLPRIRTMRRVRLSQRPTAEVPHVKRRLASLVHGGLAPVTETPRIWVFRRSDPHSL